MRKAADNRGVLLDSRAQQFHPLFFKEYNYILVADAKLLKKVREMSEAKDYLGNLCLMNDWSSHWKHLDVPDPYFEPHPFDLVLDMMDEIARNLIRDIRKNIKEIESVSLV
jgi:protein-tyrosine-phosphatase